MAKRRPTNLTKIARNRMQARQRMRVMRYMKYFVRKQNSNVKTVQIEECDDKVFEYDNGNSSCRTYSELKFELRSWVSKHHISQRAVDGLLKILHSSGLDGLPNSCKTLMQTPKKVLIRDVAGGKQWYSGIENGLRIALKNIKADLVIQLHFNIDGLPIFNSSTASFWPILARIQSKSN